MSLSEQQYQMMGLVKTEYWMGNKHYNHRTGNVDGKKSTKGGKRNTNTHLSSRFKTPTHNDDDKDNDGNKHICKRTTDKRNTEYKEKTSDESVPTAPSTSSTSTTRHGTTNASCGDLGTVDTTGLNILENLLGPLSNEEKSKLVNGVGTTATELQRSGGKVDKISLFDASFHENFKEYISDLCPAIYVFTYDSDGDRNDMTRILEVGELKGSNGSNMIAVGGVSMVDVVQILNDIRGISAQQAVNMSQNVKYCTS
ncbi:MAG: hypothetical protein ACTSUE_10660 [Promethearchaeota archaeon]